MGGSMSSRVNSRTKAENRIPGRASKAASLVPLTPPEGAQRKVSVAGQPGRQ
jgi:hypothetical protein